MSVQKISGCLIYAALLSLICFADGTRVNSQPSSGFYRPYYPPPAPRPPTCNQCNEVGLGFDHLLYKLKYIHEELMRPCPPVQPTPGRHPVVRPPRRSPRATPLRAGEPCSSFTVYGPPSTAVLFSPSVATCPDGTVLVGCRCDAEDRTCDGVTGTPTTCTAFKGSPTINTNPVRAIAQCTGNDDGKYTHVQDPKQVSCTGSAKMVECWLYNPFTVSSGQIDTDIDGGTNTCSATPPESCDSGFCLVTGVCDSSI